MERLREPMRLNLTIWDGSRFVKLFSRYTTKYILKIERRLERLCCMEQNVRPIKIRHVQQLSAVEMRILWWICGHTRMDRVRNDDIRDRLKVASIKEKLVQYWLRWFGHVQRKHPKAPVHRGVLSQANNMMRDREKPKLIWGETIKKIWKLRIYLEIYIWIGVLGK